MTTLAIDLLQLAVIVERTLWIAKTAETGGEVGQVIQTPIIQLELFIKLLSGQQIFQRHGKVALKGIHGSAQTAGIGDQAMIFELIGLLQGLVIVGFGLFHIAFELRVPAMAKAKVG